MRPRTDGDSARGNLSDAQRHLLAVGKGDGEGAVQDAISRWLAGIGVESRPQYRTPAGTADLHLMQRRCIIEVKRPGRLDAGPMSRGSGSDRGGAEGESAFGQLERYVLSSRQAEPGEGAVQWRGAITDGRVWWVWEWPLAGEGDSPRPYGAWENRRLTPENIAELESALRRRGAGKPWAPDDPVPQFADMLGRFRSAYRRRRDVPDTRTQRSLWLEQLKGGGNHPASDRDADELFVVHTVLMLISRLVAGMRVPKGRRGVADASLLHGFVGWAAAAPAELDALQDIVDRYDWRAGSADVMRALYMGLVPVEQRRSYGEYYTPDWLAEKVCADVIDDGYIAEQVRAFMEGGQVGGILDPACGSGTFLYHAARRLRDSRPVRESYLNHNEVADFICSMVNGIDIHPVAVEMSVANMCRLLGDIDLAKVRVYQGDSLLIRRPESSVHSAGTESMSLYTPNGRTLVLPRGFLLSGADIEKFVRSARDGRPLPPGVGRGMGADGAESVRAAHAEMSKIVREEGNGVWAWYIRNQAAPLLLRGGPAVRRIVSNPPWVRLNAMSDAERAASVRGLASDLGMYEGGRRATAFDIASLFVARCHDLYAGGSKGGDVRAGWILPQTAMAGGGQWERLRSRFGDRLEALWDLGSLPFPRQGPSSALLVGRQGAEGAPARLRMDLEGPGARRPDQHDSWSGSASSTLRLVPADAGGSRRGKRQKQRRPQAPSAWAPGGRGRGRGKKGRIMVRNGATLFPAPLVRIEPGTLSAGARTASFRTRAGRHGAWREIGAQEGTVPAAWIRQCMFGSDLVAFCAPTRTACVIPMGPGGRWLDGRGSAKFWRDASSLYAANRGSGRHTPATLEDRLDYQGGLSWQMGPDGAGPFVAYNKSGSRVYAAAITTTEVVDNTIYAVRCASAAEARYVSAILNSDALQGALAGAKENQRHYDTYPWKKIPIPRYSRAEDSHRRLAALAGRAEAAVASLHRSDPGGACRRGSIEAVRRAGILGRIDECVAVVLPEHAG